MLYAKCIQLCADALGHHIFIVLLEVLCNARDESCTNRCEQKQTDAADEIALRDRADLRNVAIDDDAEHLGIHQRKTGIDRGKDQGKSELLFILLKVGKKKLHKKY